MIRGELAELAEGELIARGIPFVEATVVRAQSPTSVRAGDAAIVHPDGTIEGFVGGTCAEASVRLYALRALSQGDPVLLRILPGEAETEPGADEGAVTVKNPCLSGGALEIFLAPRLPAATLRIAGESPIALALADLGRRLDFAVELDRPADCEPRADDAVVVVASHGHEEGRILTSALSGGVPYVGLVASQVRGDAVKESLELPPELRARLHTPAGLAIGAHSPAEIALAILAEIVSLRRSREDGAQGAPLAPHEAGRGEERRPSETAIPTADTIAATVEVAVDPVCGMEVAVTEASIQVERDGERYYFCSEGCRESFAAADARVG